MIRPAAAREHRIAGGHRGGAAGPAADWIERHLVGDGTLYVRLPVAALRYERGRLCRSRGGDLEYLFGRLGGCGLDLALQGDRNQHGRVGLGGLGGDGCGDCAAARECGLPAVTGTAQQGQQLSDRTAPGRGRRPSPCLSVAALRYGRGGLCRSRGSDLEYLLGRLEQDVGSTLRFEVTASNAARVGLGASRRRRDVVSAAPQPPANTGLPVVTGRRSRASGLTVIKRRTDGELHLSPTPISAQHCDCDRYRLLLDVTGATAKELMCSGRPMSASRALRFQVTACRTRQGRPLSKLLSGQQHQRLGIMIPCTRTQDCHWS